MKQRAMALVFYLITIFFIISCVTGIFFDVMPKPVDRSLFRMMRHIHIWLSYITLILTIIHLYQNWSWVKGVWGRFKKLASQGKAMATVFYMMTVSFIIVNLTGVSLHLKYIVLPHGWTKRIHDYTSYILMILVLYHLYQNRKYLVKLFKK